MKMFIVGLLQLKKKGEGIKNMYNPEKCLVAEKVGVKYAVALSCGTAALHLAMKLAGVKKDAYCFASDMTFDATVNPILYEGGIPVFIDTEYDTWNMDPVALEKVFKLYPDSLKIVVLPHLYGTPAKMDEIKAVCDKYGAIIVEDAAESFGATYRGKCTNGETMQTGSFGNVGCISCNGNNLTALFVKTQYSVA